MASSENQNNEQLDAKYSAHCIVSNRVLKDGARVGFLYREAADRDDDSGWCITAGDESQDYMDDVTNVSYVTLSAVLKCDSTIMNLLDSEVGAEFVRVGSSALFVRA